MPNKNRPAKVDFSKSLVIRLTEAVTSTLNAANVACSDCTAEQLAVDLQQIISDSAQQTAMDELSILGELLLLLDDCKMGGTDGTPDPPGAP